MNRIRSTIAIAAMVLLVTSCFSEPVLEKLQIEFGPPGSLVDLTASIEIRDGAAPKSPLAVRLDRLRDDLVAERDFWSNRFRIVAPADDEYRRERSGGKISKVIRRTVMDRNDLARLLDGFASGSFISGTGWEELNLDAGRSDRATSQEKRVVGAKLDSWSQEFANHVGTVVTLLRYLDEHPERARLVVAHVLVKEGLDDKYRRVELTEDEEELIALVTKGNDAVIATLAETDSAAYTFEEMTRRVYDPFPAEVTVTTAGTIVECEGFVCTEGRVARIRKLSLLGSLPALDRWASPDPLMMMVREGERNLETDLDEFLESPRSVAAVPPTAVEIRSTIDRILTPAATYRLRWRTPEPDQVPPPSG